MDSVIKSKWLWIAAAAIIGGLLWWWTASDATEASAESENSAEVVQENDDEQVNSEDASEGEASEGEAEAEQAEEEAEQAEDEAEEPEDPEEKQVSGFDEEVDKWMEVENTKPPELKQIEAFVAKFKGLPDARKEECLQRALNLIPDANVLLLAGILMDKSVDRQYMESIYNDILNRDEAVKQPILEIIYEDKTHPCWADTAWILDVTGAKENSTQETENE